MNPTLEEIERVARRVGLRRERTRRAGQVVLPRFADLRFQGKLRAGRRGTIGFAGVASKTRVRLSVEADEAVHFTVLKQSWAEWLGFAFGLGEPVHVEAPERERALLAKRAVRGAIDELFLVERIESLELAQGELVLLAPFFSVPPERYERLLELLDGIARSFDRTTLRVRVLRAVRRALSGEHGPRCAYCHGGLSGEEEGLVACECCATVLHESCWHENGHCPVLGCIGEEPEGGASARDDGN